MFRLADGVVIRAASHVVTVNRPGHDPVELRDDEGRLRALIELLADPATEAELQARDAARAGDGRAAAAADDGLAGRLEVLVSHGVVVWSDLPARLSELHERTVTPGSWPPGNAGEETSRLLREQAPGSVVLPAAESVDVRLVDALMRRRTPRAFHDGNVSMQSLATILALGAGSREEPAVPLVSGGPPGPRTYPAAGGLYAVEVLVLPARVEQLAPHVYLYQVQSHRLARVAPPPSGERWRWLLNDHPVEHAAVFVLLFADLTRPSLGKYGEKAYRMLLLEAGHVAQNLLLVAAAQGLQGLPICGFRDADLTGAVRLRWPHQPVLYVLALGAEETEPQ